MSLRSFVLLPIVLGLVAGAVRAEEPAWSEKTIRAHVDFAAAAAASEAAIDALIAEGRALFTAKFTTADGAGRPKATQAIVPTKRKRGENAPFQRTGGPDASACSGCHNDPVVGAAGEFVANVFVSEGFESADFDSLDPAFSNERNTNHLMGAGLVELLAREMTSELQAQRRTALEEARRTDGPVDQQLVAKGVAFGWITATPDGMIDFSRLEGVDNDLVVRPFSQKGVFTSLRQFTINAMNVHHGMQATERFGVRWTGSADFDEDGVGDELSAGDISALTLFQATLPPPTRRSDLPADWAAAAKKGEEAFTSLGCATCHVPALPLDAAIFADPGPFDAAGTLRGAEAGAQIAIDLARFPWLAGLARDGQGRVLVPLFGDLKRHKIVDTQVADLGNELMGQRFVERDIFMTAELWGIGSTAPYGHRGDITTLDGVIRAHGGEGRQARDAYVKAGDAVRSSLIAFLKSLVIEK